jgi:hypothetical protein
MNTLISLFIEHKYTLRIRIFTKYKEIKLISVNFILSSHLNLSSKINILELNPKEID